MTGSVRSRREEYVSPRPLILTLCFLWGIAMGFLLNFYRQPESGIPSPPAVRQGPEAAMAGPQSVASELERRMEGTPTIAAIEPAAETAPGERLSMENTPVPLPAVLLTTEGGLTGRLAVLPRAQDRPAPAAPPPQSFAPLIPDLDP